VAEFSGSTFARSAGRWLIITGVFELGLAALFFFIGLSLGEEGASGGMFATAAILGFLGTLLVIGGVMARNRAAESDKIDTIGLPGQATITGLTQTGMSLNDNPQMKMDLSVSLPGMQPYDATHKEFVPLMLLPQVQPGAVLPVHVDRDDPAKIVIDWDAPMPVPVAAASDAGSAAADAPSQAAPMPAAAAGTGETLQHVQQELQASGVASAPPFTTAEQGGYTVEQLRQYLREHGEDATARIDMLQDTGKNIGTDRLIVMQVTVMVPGKPPVQTPQSAAMVPQEKVPKLVLGAMLPCRVAPENPDALTFLWERI
jgi:hypothetical protein